MSKIDQKQNWVKLKSVQTLLRIACLANRKSYVVIIYANSCDKLTKSEIHFVMLKSVRTLLKIACVADRKSYVVIIYASQKFTKSEIYSNIAQNSSQFDL